MSTHQMSPACLMDIELLRKEKRTGVACEECRKRKRKCDGFRPACTSCTASQKDCLYAGTVETRKRKQWDAEYVSVLEEQVSTLRAQAVDLQRTQTVSLSLTSDERGEHNPQTSSARRSSESSLAAKLSEDINLPTNREPAMLALSQLPAQHNPVAELSLSSSAIDDLSALVWRMNIGDKGEPTFIGPSGNFCVPSSADSFTVRSGARCVPQTEVGHPMPEVCYDLSIKSSLCSLFFSQLNPIHQFLPPSIQLAPDLYPFNDLSRTILHSAVFAAGALFSIVEEEREAGAEFATCIDISAVKACREQPSLVMVQALSIAAWRELSLEHNSCASIYISMAGGLAVGLGLHVIGLDALSESKSSRTLLTEERETRLRTFWAFFLVDRIATTMLGRNCVIPWRRVEVPLLHSVLCHTLSIDELAFSHQCRLWQLHDNFMDQIYSFNFKALDFIQRHGLLLSARAELLAFKQTIPSSLLVPTSRPTSRPTSIPPRSVLFLQISYQTSLLLIHRPYLREPPDSSSFTLALATMSSAATRITQYIQLFYKHYLQYKSGVEPTPALPFIIHHVLTASIMHLLLGTARTASQISLVRHNLQICLDILSALETPWPIASKAIAQIQELAVQWNIIGALPLKWSFVNERNAQNIVTAASEIPNILDPKNHSDSAARKPRQQDSDTISHVRREMKEDLPPTAVEAQYDSIGEAWTTQSQGDLSILVDHASGVDYSGFPTEAQEPINQSDSMANNNAMPSWLDPRFLPDFSALQDVFDFPEFNIPL